MGMILTTTSYGCKMWHHRFLMFPAMLVCYFGILWVPCGWHGKWSLYVTGEVWTPIPHLPSPQAVCTVCFGPVGIVCVTHKVLQAEEEYNKNTGHGRLKLWYAISIMKMNSTYCFLSQTEKLYTNLRTNDVCVSDRSCSPPTFELLPFGPEPSGIECSWSSQFVGFGGCFWELAFQIEQATFSFAGKRSQEWNSSGCVGR